MSFEIIFFKMILNYLAHPFLSLAIFLGVKGSPDKAGEITVMSVSSFDYATSSNNCILHFIEGSSIPS